MKLHFSSLDEFALQELAAALEYNHSISSSPKPLDPLSDGLVIGVDTTKDHPDIAKAKELGIEIYSVPDILYHLSQDKQRLVITGSLGKRAVASWILRLLQSIGKEFDYALTGRADGFDCSVKISDAPIVILEGSENKCSVLDPRPQFLRLHHHIALITDLTHQWEALYPSFDDYVREFDRLADATPKGGTVVYCEEDDLVTVIGGKEREGVKSIPYSSYPGSINGSVALLDTEGGPLEIASPQEGGLQHIGGAFALLKRLSITDEQFYQAIKSLE